MLWFILIVIVRPCLCVFEFCLLCVGTAGKELSSWLSACAVEAVLSDCVPFPFGQYVKNSNVAVTDQCVRIYFDVLVSFLTVFI